MIRIFAACLLAALVGVGCNTNPAAFEASKVNKSAIGNIHLEQSFDQVKAIMGSPPESTAVRLLDNGVHETVWYYLTDYEGETNTAITFHNGKVVAIAASQWLGDGTFPNRKK
jgi:hypothetical protein